MYLDADEGGRTLGVEFLDLDDFHRWLDRNGGVISVPDRVNGASPASPRAGGELLAPAATSGGDTSTVVVEAPVEQIYQYWQNLESLPQIMTNIEEMRSTGPYTAHWRVKGLLGAKLGFDARTTQDEPNQAIGWNTVEGNVQTSGQVRFQELGPDRTRVEATIDYADPPGGRLGEAFFRAISDPKVKMQQDLQNFKEIIEGTATPEQIQQRPAASAHSGAVAAVVDFLTSGVGLLAVGGLVLFLLLRRRGGGSSPGGCRGPLLGGGAASAPLYLLTRRPSEGPLRGRDLGVGVLELLDTGEAAGRPSAPGFLRRARGRA